LHLHWTVGILLNRQLNQRRTLLESNSENKEELIRSSKQMKEGG
jgi:hypothetical protein